MTIRTGFIWDERFAWFHSGLDSEAVAALSAGAGARYARDQRAYPGVLVVTGLSEKLVSVPATPIGESDILRLHTPEYVAKVRALSERGGGDVGEGAWIGPNSYDLVRLSAGACAAWSMPFSTGRSTTSTVLCKGLAGHHATRDFGRGFCIFSEYSDCDSAGAGRIKGASRGRARLGLYIMGTELKRRFTTTPTS